MRKTACIWFVGCGAWIIDGGVSINYHDWLHAGLAFIVAMVFFTAGMLFRKSHVEPRGPAAG